METDVTCTYRVELGGQLLSGNGQVACELLLGTFVHQNFLFLVKKKLFFSLFCLQLITVHFAEPECDLDGQKQVSQISYVKLT